MWYMAFLGEENGVELAVTSLGGGCALDFTWKVSITENKAYSGFSAFFQLLQYTMIYLLAIHENFLNWEFTFIFSSSLLNVAIRDSLSPFLCIRHQFFPKWFKKQNKTELSVKPYQMANAILPNSEMEVRDRKLYKLCLLLYHSVRLGHGHSQENNPETLWCFKLL